MTPGAEALAGIEAGVDPGEAEAEDAVQAEYPRVKERILQLVERLIPERSRVLVVSKGDEELVRLNGREGWHFPRTQTGQYGGYHPADASSAVAHLEELRTVGADYFLLPSTYFWWLDHYPELDEHLRESYQLITRRADSCLIYHLNEPPGEERSTGPIGSHLSGLASDSVQLANLLPSMRSLVSNLLPDDAVVLVASEGEDSVLRLGRDAWHFPHDSSGGYVPLDPDDGYSPVAQLEVRRTQGIRYLLVPRTSFPEIRECHELLHYLQRRCRVVAARERICVLFELGEPMGAADAGDANGPEPDAAGHRPARLDRRRGRFLRRLLGTEEGDTTVSGDG